MGLFPKWYNSDQTWTVSEADKKFIVDEPKCLTCNMVLPKTGVCDDCN